MVVVKGGSSVLATERDPSSDGADPGTVDPSKTIKKSKDYLMSIEGEILLSLRSFLVTETY